MPSAIESIRITVYLYRRASWMITLAMLAKKGLSMLGTISPIVFVRFVRRLCAVRLGW